MRNKRYNKTDKTDSSKSKTISTPVNIPRSEQKEWTDHTPTTHEPLPHDHSLQQGGWEDDHTDTTKKREREWYDQMWDINDITRQTWQKDQNQNQYQIRSTYPVLNRSSGRIALQQDTNHFHVTIPCSIVDRKVTILWRWRNGDINHRRRDNKWLVGGRSEEEKHTKWDIYYNLISLRCRNEVEIIQ